MKPYALHRGDVLEVLRTLPDNSVDSIVTDPPYELGFMGKSWDASGIAYNVDMWREALRVLKPGGHLLAFSGSRTYHRMTSAIEDAGFEVRDQIMWVYSQGYPKSRNIAKHDMGGADAEAWSGWGTALKPAHEPICMARKPFPGTVASNVLKFGTGAINVDACRVEPTGESRERIGEASQDLRYTDFGATNFSAKPGVRGGALEGRHPANLIHDGSDEVRAAFPDAPGQQGDLVNHGKCRQSPNGIFGGMRPALDHMARHEVDKNAARFFYCAKASSSDRHEGLEDPGPQFKHGTTLRQVENTEKRGNHHPTVKPTDLMAYLCRLVTPHGGLVLDPFTGSGSTGKAAMREGFQFIGIELDEGYLSIARARIAHEFEKVSIASIVPITPQLDLFSENVSTEVV